MNSLFNSRYPIVEAVMNQVSTPELAAAVDEAGAFPSLFIHEYKNGALDIDCVHDILLEFQKLTGHTNVLTAISLNELKNEKLLRLINQFKISHVELWGLVDNRGQSINFNNVYNNSTIKNDIDLLKLTSKVLLRIVDPVVSSNLSWFDGVCIKGQESAGRTGSWKVKDLFVCQQKINSNISLIPYGGVGTPSQVAEYIKLGADSVAVGTLFAATNESPLSLAAKNKIVESSSANLICDSTTKQNLIPLTDSINRDSNDWNNTAELIKGVSGNGTHGLIYAGHSIDYVTKIRSVKETVEFLISELPHDFT
jgi:NAD(P)H-dependent flavin oxidoreductase YrpB (nitropropane dioxygenase family)